VEKQMWREGRSDGKCVGKDVGVELELENRSMEV
jgi:hypothetical protein